MTTRQQATLERATVMRSQSIDLTIPILLLSVLILLGAQTAAACKCVQDPSGLPAGSEATIAADLADSTAVFTGRVTRRQSRIRLYLRIPRYLFLTRGDREIPEEEEKRIFRRRVQLRVEESFKGAAARNVLLYTGWGGGDCGYEFERGSRYLVYASEYGGGLYTGICYGTKRVERAEDEIAVLRRLAAPPRQGRGDSTRVSSLAYVSRLV